MPYNPKLAGRIRTRLLDIQDVSEQEKMGGITFSIGGKVCVRAHSDGAMMLRCEPNRTEELLLRTGAVRFEMKGRSNMKGWLLISPDGIKSEKDFSFWMKVATDSVRKLLA